MVTRMPVQNARPEGRLRADKVETASSSEQSSSGLELGLAEVRVYRSRWRDALRLPSGRSRSLRSNPANVRPIRVHYIDPVRPVESDI